LELRQELVEKYPGSVALQNCSAQDADVATAQAIFDTAEEVLALAEEALYECMTGGGGGGGGSGPPPRTH
jgi:hypothetical protein